MSCIVDNRADYFAASAKHRAADPLDFQRRYLRGLRLLAELHRPKVRKPDNVLRLRRRKA